MRLQRFEQTGEKGSVGTYRTDFMRRDEKAGFSAHDLLESLARYWDVHVIGPHRLIELDFEDPNRVFDEFFKKQYFAFKEKGMIIHPQHGGYSDIAFDLAMDASAGNYAKPYRYIRDSYNPVITGTLFPIAGYFAMQTENPVQVFGEVVEKVSLVLDKLPRGDSIHNLWKTCFPLVRDFTLQHVRDLGYSQLITTGMVINNGHLREHPVYKWAFSEMNRTADLLGDTELALDIGKTYRNAPPGVLGILALDYCLCCPGDPTIRSFLVEWLAPPCVEFANGKTWLLPELYRRELVPETGGTEESLTEQRRQVAAQAVDIEKRWQAFRREVRGY